MSQFETNFTPIWGPVVDGNFIVNDPMGKMGRGEYLDYEVSQSGLGITPAIQ